MLAALLYGALSTARSAEVTALPPEMSLRGALTYSGYALSGGLQEQGAVISRRRLTRHDLTLGASFSPLSFAMISLDLAMTPALRYTYPLAREMVLDPATGSGSYLSGAPSEEVPAVRASGITGLWLGGAISPLPAAPGRGQWRIDAALRTPSTRRNLWSAPKGSRGPSPGGVAWKLVGAFSTEAGIAEPWLRATVIREGAFKVDVIDEDGVTWASDLEIQPASTVELAFGGEIEAWADAEAGRRVAVTPSLAATYRSWEDIASGVYLPYVLTSSRRVPVTAGDGLMLTAGLDVDVAAAEELSVRAGAELTSLLPYRLEHVYDVRTTPGTFAACVTLSVAGGSVLPIGR